MTNLATKAAFIEDRQLFWFGIGSVLYQHSLFQWTTNDCLQKWEVETGLDAFLKQETRRYSTVCGECDVDFVLYTDDDNIHKLCLWYICT